MNNRPPPLLNNLQMTDNLPLHYYKGKLKAVSGNKIYFLDQRNAAVVDISNVYLHGRQLGGTEEELEIFHSALSHGWSERLEIHSYVGDSFSDSLYHNGPVHLFGKRPWQARIAWVGSTPPAVNYISRNIVYMPVSYYTGHVITLFEDRVLFGDARNGVIVHRENFFVKGERNSGCDIRNAVDGTDSVIHAYVCRVQILTDARLKGPEPSLPPWPKGLCRPDLWVAIFAWQGPMPVQVKDQVDRYYIIRLNEWVFRGCPPWVIGSNFRHKPTTLQKEINRISNYNDNAKDLVPETDGKVPWVPMDQKPGIMKGSILIADHKQALMTSFADVIAFEKENFYVNGKKFRSSSSLGHFFQDREAHLTAWVLPLKKLKCIFHINVAWYAPCVWIGSVPAELLRIEHLYMSSQEIGSGLVESIASSSSLRFTHLWGELSSISHTHGVFRSRANQQPVDVAFKRKVVYMQGFKVSSNISLVDKKAELESNTMSMLAYPVATDIITGVRQYRAIAVWQFQYQNYMGMIPAILSEAVDVNGRPHNGPVSPVEDNGVFHMAGWIVWICADFGIIKTKSKENLPVFLYFKKSLLYIDGELWNDSFSLHEISAHQQCKMIAKPVPERNLFGFMISMEATLVWFGVRPSNCQGELVDVRAQESKLPEVNATDGVQCSSVLHAVHGLILGTVLMTDDDQGLILANKNIVAFSRQRFYVDGENFMQRHSSLSDFCSGRQVNVRAMVVPQQEAKVILGCKVICEAICAWIGEEPNNLENLESEYNKQRKKRDTSSVQRVSPTDGYFYMFGNITKMCDYMGLLSCPVPDGYVNVAFKSSSFFRNGARLPAGSKLHKSFSLSNYSCLVYPVSPTKYYGATVRFSAIAVWNSVECHKVRGELLQLLTSEIHKLSNHKSNGKSSKRTADISLVEMSTAIQEIDDRPRNDVNPTLSLRSAVSKRTKETKETVEERGVSNSTKKYENEKKMLDRSNANEEERVEPTTEFYGRHVTGNVIQKCEEGGVAVWKSYQLMGCLYILFSCRVLYVDLKPLKKKFQVSDVQNRACNFFVKPIPHRTVSGYTVSIEATCGWIGKKPQNIPRPGAQELANLSLSEAHLTPFDDVSHLSSEELPSHLQEFEELPLVPVMHNRRHNQRAHTNGNNNLYIVFASPPAAPSRAESSNSDGIWGQRSKKAGHQLGTVTEVFASMGQLKGEDGKHHYFTKDLCYLYGVTLRNVELWHVLVQGEKVVYTSYESKPGSSKVDGVWLGAMKVDGVQKTASLISEWCEKNLVPDSAREVLVSQLQVS